MWKKGENVQHLVSGCEKWAQKEYKRRNDDVAMKVYCDLCKKNGLDQMEKWYENVPERAIENKEVKVMWDINVQYDNMIETKKKLELSNISKINCLLLIRKDYLLS